MGHQADLPKLFLSGGREESESITVMPSVGQHHKFQQQDKQVHEGNKAKQ